MKLQNKIQKYSDMFESKTRENGESYVVLKKDRADKLQESVYQAHGDRMPNDWIYGTYADLMQRLTEYDINSIDDVYEYQGEIVDGAVDVYTADLTQWLADDIRNVDYITQAVDTFGNQKDGAGLLATAQYMAIDEIYGHIINLLSE